MPIYIRNRKNGVYWTRFTIQGRRIHQSTGFSDKAKAIEYEAKLRIQMLDSLRLGRKPERCWEEAAGEWLIQHDGKRSLAKDKEILAWLHPYLSGVKLTEISRDLIERIRQRKRKQTSAATANRYMALVRSILRLTVDLGWIDSAPKVPCFRVEAHTIQALSRDQADNLVAELPPHLAAMARFTLETGLRRHNVTHLQWRQIDMPRRCAWIPAGQAKGKRAISIPLTEAAMAILTAQIGQDLEYVFVYQGKPVYQTSTKAWRQACLRAGVPALRWHDLRHAWASWMAQAGVPLLALQELGGWQSVEMVRRYAHFQAEHLREYAERGSQHQNRHQAFAVVSSK